MPTTIDPSRVRYIKLGREGRWEKECLEKGIIRFGFGTASSTRFPLCQDKKWDELKKIFLAETESKGTASRFTKEVRLFFEDDGTTLWITFIGERLYWGLLDPTPPAQHVDGDGVFRNVVNGWRGTDLKGAALTKDRLSGALTKLAAYRGTSCKVVESDYVVRRINGDTIPEVERALVAVEAMKSSVQDLMKKLEPRDFEILVDLVFTTSGWRRLGVVGKTQKTLDLDLQLPSTGERAFVQVKSQTSSTELAKYVATLDDLGDYQKMFYVYHSGEGKTDDGRVTVLGPKELADLVIDAGLVTWLIHKVS